MQPAESGDPAEKLRVLVVGLLLDGTDVGGTYASFKWVEALGRRCDLTLLCLERPGRVPMARQLPHVRVVSWPEPGFLARFERVRAQLKPAWPLFAYRARRWIADALEKGERFDVAHHINPQAMRHASPLRSFGIPYVIGPQDGSLPTPQGMKSEVRDGLMTRLRAIDRVRLRYDPGLRATYKNAALVLGVAPYVKDVLSDVPLRRFATRLERAGDPAPDARWTPPQGGELRLLHVGRVVRTKGLRDMVRAMAELDDLPNVRLTSAGDGPDLEACRAEAAALGVADRIEFLGQIPRAHVERLYATHHVFAFPTFREPMGGVFFEAMRWGLPVVTADYGGPVAIVDEKSGLRIPVTTPQQFPKDIAAAIRSLASTPELLVRYSEGVRRRMKELGDWDDKARDTEGLYRELI
ncbi:glycosyltransferase family 4 protein [Phenylobacterium sp.]|uniref:glycosyltransferase family 4 protein n=1 Tax=Phenylobacterium sp. TaxID=1871053 RepID=UPI00301B9D2E